MMKNYKKAFAGLLAGAMVLTSGFGAVAADTSEETETVNPADEVITVSVANVEGSGSLWFYSLENPQFDEEGYLVGYDSKTELEGDSVEVAEGDYVYFGAEPDPGYEVKVNIAPHQIVRFTFDADEGDDVTSYYAFWDADFNALGAQEDGATSNQPYDVYYLKISEETTLWAERTEEVLGTGTAADLTINIGFSVSDAEIVLDTDTLSDDTVVTVIDTSNNNNLNMGTVEYKGYSTEDTYVDEDGNTVEGGMYTNWYGDTYAKDGFVPAEWTTATQGAAQFRSGEGVQIAVSDPENYSGINVYYVDDDGNEVSVDVTTDPSEYPMYIEDGSETAIAEEADGTWYFTVPFVKLADHLTLVVDFVEA
ncbi:MAG: hypothetical protein LIO94_13590 [Clostridiales bacterium]|nr:hypothetical protein [Clostridiales bacterium]